MWTASGMGSQTRRALVVGGLLAAVLVAAFFGPLGAFAQAPASPGSAVDTKYTQQPKDGTGIWTQVGGERFSTGEMVPGSPTPRTVDLYAVAFDSAATGYAGGAECVTPGATDAELATCADRVPVLYGFRDPDGLGGTWTKVALPGGERPGYVGGIAFLGADRVLVVGGDGTYPRRERSPSASDGDPAGRARAWLLEDGRWAELPALPAAMGGLTAVSGSPRPSDCGPAATDCAFAGGLRQLWRWSDGRFAPATFDAGGQPTTETPAALAFRVRSLRFVPGSLDAPPDVRAVGVTAGCCSADPTQNVPRLLALYDGRWHVGPLFGQTTVDERLQTLPDSALSIVPTREGALAEFSLVVAPGGPQAPAEPNSAVVGRAYMARPDPNRTFDPLGVGRSVLGLAAPLAGQGEASDIPREALRGVPNDVRLAAGDGDFAGPPRAGFRPSNPIPFSPFDQTTRAYQGADGYLDWAVGEVRSSGRAAVFTTTAEQEGLEAPDPLDCPGRTLGPNCRQRGPADVQRQLASKSTFVLDSYGLNAVAVPEAGSGWAVGDRGALQRLGGQPAVAEDAAGSAPQLGSPQDTPFPDTSAYRPFAPVGTGEPGPVPPLAARPVERLPEPRLVSAGSPDPNRSAIESAETAGTIVMSRDGSEGWALGAAELDGPLTLMHYVDGEWRRCAPSAVSSQQPADPACASLEKLRGADGSRPARVLAAARVPLERDDDPANDDEFEVVALGDIYTASDGQPHLSLLRYRRGRWSYDDRGSIAADPNSAIRGAAPSGVAFAAPDDGWLTQKNRVARYDGRGWHDCGGPDLACADPAGLLPTGSGSGNEPLRLVQAGRRIYLYGSRPAANSGGLGEQGAGIAAPGRPVILYRDAGLPCEQAGDPGCWRSDDGGLDALAAGSALAGETYDLSVAQNADGSYSGWAVGDYRDGNRPFSLLRLTRDGSGRSLWSAWTTSDASTDYLDPNPALPVSAIRRPARVIALPAAREGEGRALVTIPERPIAGPQLEYIPAPGGAPGRWRTLATPWSPITTATGNKTYQADVTALGPDGRGGAWLVARPQRTGGLRRPGTESYQPRALFYRYTNIPPRPVFDDVAHPIREPVTATAAGGDGSFWVGTATGTVYRYDRVTGWGRITVRGWDPGRLVTRASATLALAVGPDGRGVMVGESGRIADLAPKGAVLDRLAGGTCGAEGCGTTRDLRAAAVAPDGSALVGGERATLLWRPPGGDFRAIPVPAASSSATITGIALPRPDRAWLAADTSQVFAGTLSGGAWSWRVENRDPSGRPLNLGPGDSRLALTAIAVDASGGGYAVGEHGLVLERDEAGGDRPWRRIETGQLADLESVTLGPGGAGALIGGWGGEILTLDRGRFRVAREPDLFDPLVAGSATFPGRIVGLAIVPGSKPGQVEAWAAQQTPDGGPADPPDSGSGALNRGIGPTAILHYSSDPSDPLLSAGPAVRPVPDAPAPRPGEIRFAAFGKSECRAESGDFCPEPVGSGLVNDVVARRVADAVAAASREAAGPSFALFTGDVADAAGPGSQAAGQTQVAASPADQDLVHRQWGEKAMRLLDARGVPLFGALGGQDLSEAQACPLAAQGCTSVRKSGLTLPWRQALAGMPAPWGTGPAPPPTADGLTFVPVPGTGDAGGQARTHYAADIRRDGRTVARLVVLDTSSRSLTAGDAQQNPVEEQSAWLQSVLCTSGQGCTRPARADGKGPVPAIVLGNAPTYSYGPGAATDTETDAAQLEALLFANDASVVVTGRIGWNALYWATAPGVHEPCPGAPYPDPSSPPALGTRSCDVSASGPVAQADERSYDAQKQALQRVADALAPLGAPPPPVGPQHVPDPTAATAGALPHVLPFVVASSAGGKFAADAANTAAANGYWQGYTVVRLAADGDPAETIVEQRPVLDWIGITARSHTVQPGRTLALDGYGRQPVGIDTPVRYVDIDSPAITHRYDLVEADPGRPYLPRTGPDGQYVKLAGDIATIDRQTGAITAGKGAHPQIFAVAILSVGDKATSWPVVFPPRRSFRAVPPSVTVVPAPARIVAASKPPPPIVLGQKPAALPPAAPPPPVPSAGNLNLGLPAPPAPPPLGPVGSPSIAPPPPPAPPAPPSAPTATALQLSLKAPSLSLAPTSSVIPPPAPPIQPAPPGGARREARQRQAATAKSESASGAQGGEAENGGSSESSSQAMTRRDTRRERYDFAALPARPQASAWSQGLLYGGGLTLLALTLALGWTAAGPRSRRREPDLPAPAWNRSRRWR